METGDLYALVSNTTKAAMLVHTTNVAYRLVADALADPEAGVEAAVEIIQKHAPAYVRYGGKGWD